MFPEDFRGKEPNFDNKECGAMPRGRKSPADKADPRMSLGQYASYAEAMLLSLRNIAILYEQPMLAHLIDLAAIEAKHVASGEGPPSP